MSGEETDERLVARIAACDEAALLELHRRYAPHIAALAERILGDPGEVHKSVEDAFVNAWEASAHFDPSRTSARTWLVMIAHRTIRHRARGKTVPPPPPNLSAASPNDAAHHRQGNALNQLEPEEQQLLELAFYQGYNHHELAELTNLPLETISEKLRTALQRLQRGGEP